MGLEQLGEVRTQSGSVLVIDTGLPSWLGPSPSKRCARVVS
jgi:hypothetical protein